MTVYTNPFEQLNAPCAVALGFFDGVHKGHQSVITKMTRYAKKNGLNAVIWTFDLSPRALFSHQKTPEITSENYKKELFRALGTDILITFPFDRKISELSCECFVKDILKNCLQAKKVFCGFNYSFGAGGKGNADTLASLCMQQGILTEIVKPVTEEGGLVSSSRIRALIENGDVKCASQLLGRPFGFEAEVVQGNRLGRTLGFPTVNQNFPDNLTIPAKGVYASRVSFDGKCFYGITNIGTKPTIGENSLGAETNIFGFDGDLYGKSIKTELLEFIRAEKKYNSIEELRAQVLKDIKTAEKIIGKK